ncbi:hypothetical protein HDV01_006353 [Terramyces sp. JEL0728]|nr:hypothetical protein HDV01_006353 [Terramyces sp. JEL0728]
MPRTQIHIVGGGAFGLSTALSLSKRGFTNITVYDRETIPAEDAASTDISKAVRIEYGKDNVYQQMAVASIKQWKLWNNHAKESGFPQLYHETGVFMVSEEGLPDSYEVVSKANVVKEGYGAFVEDNKDVGPDEFPGLKTMRSKMPKGHYNRLGGWVDSSKSIEYLRYLLIQQRVGFVTGQKGTLKKLRRTDGQISGIVMEDGSCHEGFVILCLGAWSESQIPELKGIVRAVGQPVVHFKLTRELEPLYLNKFCVWTADLAKTGFYGFPSNDGRLKIANHGAGFTFNQNGVSAPKTVRSHPDDGYKVPVSAIEAIKNFTKEYLPQVAKCDVCFTRMCWYTDSFDGDFVIGRIPGQRGAMVATGGSGHAFKFLPLLGDIVADAMQGVENDKTMKFKWRFPQNKILTEAARAQLLPTELEKETVAGTVYKSKL